MADNRNTSLLAMPVLSENFVAQLSGKIITSSASNSFTFTGITGTNRTTFKITNKGTKGAYIGWGASSAGAVTAVASAVYNSSTNTGTANCDYVGAGAILTQDFQSVNGPVDTIAAIQGSDSQDSATTTLEITVGFGQ